MATLFRWLLRATTFALVAGVVAVLALYFLASRSLPDYDKALPVRGITADIEIVRDNNAVPHILGLSDRDAFFGLGYAHTQDRLWQMTLMRRLAQGRLSEVLGMRTVETDKLMRRLDLYSAARLSVAAQDAATLDALEAYSAGVNARLEEINADSLGRGAPEFFLYEAPLAPWQPADSIALLKLFALMQSSHLGEEVLRARVSMALENPDRLPDILPDPPGRMPPSTARYSSLVENVPAGLTVDPTPFADLWPIPVRGLSGSSNAWAAEPDRSAGRGTLMANDIHQVFSAPSLWYLARLRLQSGDVIGGTVPGIPAVLAGRSDRLAWGMTASYLDDQDLFVEQIDPADPERYRTPDGWAEFRTRRSIVEIKDASPITLTLRWTENGPVLPRAQLGLAAVSPPGHLISLAWTGLSEADTSLSAAVALMSAGSVAQGLEAARPFVSPPQNLVLIDGSAIAMKLIGAVPRRDTGHQSGGRLPTPGWIAANRWKDIMDYALNPAFAMPGSGVVGNTNNKLVDRPFPGHVSYDWGDTQRVQRWQAMMQGRDVHTRDSFIEAQLDALSPAARTLLPLVGRDLWYTGEAAPEGTPARRRQRALDLLADWNGEMNEHIPEPLIYAAWLRAVQSRLIRDDLGPLAAAFQHVEPLFVERVYRDVDGASVWCDIRRSARIESCTDIARLALDDALLWIEETYGTELESLRWGDAHQTLHRHPVLGSVPLLRYFVNLRQSTSGGDHTLMRGQTWGHPVEPFRNVMGAGYRGVYDFADPDSSVYIASMGQSGHFLSRHYDDMGQLWRRGEYIPMSLDEDLARAASVGITRLIKP